MKKAIGELFANGTVTKEDLERFQQNYWEQMVPNFSQALKLLDIHDVSRHSVLWSINDRLLEAVKTKIQAKAKENGDERKLQKLWQKLIRTGMAYIQHPYMRSAIMMVLGKMNTIKSRHVSMIVENEHLYKDAPLPVLRHIWMLHEKKFNEEVKNVLQTYQNSWFESLLDALYASVTSNLSSNSDTLPLLYWPPRRRRRDNSLLKIVEMIGESQALYEKTLDFLREECLRLQLAVERSNSQRKLSTTLPDICVPPPSKRARESSTSSKKIKKEESSGPDLETKSPPLAPFISPALLPNPQSMAATALCTVRFDLLMSFNEARQDQMCIADPIHHFVWCMDACIRNKKIDRRHACELAYHLNRHRRKSSVRHGLESEVGLDQDTSADWAPDTDEKVPLKKNSGDFSLRFPKHQRTGDKRAPSRSIDPDDEASGSTSKHPRVGEVGPTENNHERDLHMICRDPCTVYTICSSLLRLVMSGLYEDKLPRNIPEVNFLVHLLMIGWEADLTPPEPSTNNTAHVSTASSSKTEVKHKHGHKRTASDDSAASADGAAETLVSPAVCLITQVLPAVGQLQVAAWRAEVGEKIRNISGSIWTDAWSSQTDCASSQSSSRPSASWQRRLETRRAWWTSTELAMLVESPLDRFLFLTTGSFISSPPPLPRINTVASPFTVSVPPAYLSQPVGNLFLQYHCLFALERREWVVLRALLRAAAGAAQQQARASKAAARAAASATSAPLSPVAGSSGGLAAASVSPTYSFRWRPECLQALALGIATLPASSDESSSNAPTLHGAGSSSSGSGGTVSAVERTGVAVGADNHSSTASIKLNRSASTGSSEHTKVSSPIKQLQSPAVTRAELASLLRASLPLQNDLQLLVLALLSRLVPGTAVGGGSAGSTGASQPSATPMPSYFSSTSAVAINASLSSQLSERERLINTLSRHCNFTMESQPPSSASALGCDQAPEPATSTAVDSVALNTPGLSSTTTGGTVASTAGAVYRTSNPKVLEALEVLRRDFERTTVSFTLLLSDIFMLFYTTPLRGPFSSSGW
ncbi:unnamed protein product [Schistocephalus solidus]|uniref:THO complex subunit 2 n=1 Tax=Schistocephalus solidus TaxID=70667 RepID=A0A183S7V1_SCHSO|nr:unnamed protein product [Schistocephalus solidus]